MNNNLPPKGTVLIVDDTPTNLNLLADHLEAIGFRVLMASSGERALKQIERLPPDIILLDIMMPEVDGFETCRRIKADESSQDIPIIFMTALDNTDSKVEGFEAGAVDYITKPFQQAEVVARINTQMAIRSLQKRLEEKNDQLEAKNQELETALAKVKLLSGLLPICASCKKIRDDEGYWQEVETYIRHHSEAEFSHGLCPECIQKLYPDLFDDQMMK